MKLFQILLPLQRHVAICINVSAKSIRWCTIYESRESFARICTWQKTTMKNDHARDERFATSVQAVGWIWHFISRIRIVIAGCGVKEITENRSAPRVDFLWERSTVTLLIVNFNWRAAIDTRVTGISWKSIGQFFEKIVGNASTRLPVT